MPVIWIGSRAPDLLAPLASSACLPIARLGCRLAAFCVGPQVPERTMKRMSCLSLAPLLVMLAGGACASSAPPVPGGPIENGVSSSFGTFECPEVVVQVAPQITNQPTIARLIRRHTSQLMVSSVRTSVPGTSIRGTAGVLVLVEEDGSLGGLKVTEGSGYASFDSAAIAVMLASEWNPGSRDGVPVSTCVVYPITFRILYRIG